jgi:hypothetical protein
MQKIYIFDCLGAPWPPFFFLFHLKDDRNANRTDRYGQETSLVVPYSISKSGNVVQYGQQRFLAVPYRFLSFVLVSYPKLRGGISCNLASKASAYIFNLASKSYNRVRNNQKGALALLPTLIHSSIPVFIQFDYNG